MQVFIYFYGTAYITLTIIAITDPADTTAKNHKIHHFTLSFHLLIFSSSPALKIIVAHPITIAHTANIASAIDIFLTHLSISVLNPHSTVTSGGVNTDEPCKQELISHEILLFFGSNLQSPDAAYA